MSIAVSDVSVFTSSEFLSAIAGAVVGALVAGVITFGCQLYALSKAREEREADHTTQQKALAHALLFKLAKIHSNLHGIHRHFWESWEAGRKELKDAQPWQVVVPLANPPAHVHLPSDEMGLLLAQRDDLLFNNVMDLEAMHNSLLDAVRVFNTERGALGERLAAVSKPDLVAGAHVSGLAPTQEINALLPKMIDVNSLVEAVLSNAKDALVISRKTVNGVVALFRTKLDLRITLEMKADADTAGSSAPGR
jgi:hypothetical protein